MWAPRYFEAHKWKHWRPNYRGSRSQSITESLPMLWDDMSRRSGYRMWWFTFVSSRLNKGVRGGGGWAADWQRESRIRAPVDSTAGSDVWTFLCVNQGHGGKWALWEDVFRQAYLKIMFFESAWHFYCPRATQGYAKRLPLLWWISFFCPSSPFARRIFEVFVCIAFSKSVFQYFFCFEGICAGKRWRWEEKYAQDRTHLCQR